MSDIEKRNPKGQSLKQFDPRKTRILIGGIKAAIGYAAKLRDWPLVDETIDTLIAEQAAFVAWWEAEVRGKGERANVTTEGHFVDDVEDQTGISKQQVSRWREKLKDREAYSLDLRKATWKRAWSLKTRQDLHDEDENRVAALDPIEGKFKTLVIDPPWDYDWLSLAGRAAPGYATMTHEELLMFDVAQWAEDDCHLYCWTTNNFMYRACQLVDAWGFQHRTVLTWVKPRWGLGSYFRNQTEHCLFATKGSLRTRRDDISTVFEAPLGEHSEKPETFYDIVRSASYLPCGEIFQRKPREGFINVFQTSRTGGDTKDDAISGEMVIGGTT